LFKGTVDSVVGTQGEKDITIVPDELKL
jgi:hypothetical protein